MIEFYLVLVAVCSYLFGSINWALIIAKSKNKDIRSMGSGNPGTLNMSRNLGLKFGILTFLLDVLKGVIPTLITFFAFRGIKFYNSEYFVTDFAIYLSGLCVVLGHIYPIFLGFKGGKGIASTIGVFITCESVHGFSWASIVVMALVAALLFIYFTEFGAMGSFIAITPPAIAGTIRLILTYGRINASSSGYHIVTNILILAICFFTWFAHRKNIERMLSGDEHPTSIKSMVVKRKEKKLEQEKQTENN